MILLTRLNGVQFALNPDLVERAEATPDTVVLLVDGTRYVVAEDLVTVIDRVRCWRASVVATAQSPLSIVREPAPDADDEPVELHERRVADAPLAEPVPIHRGRS